MIKITVLRALGSISTAALGACVPQKSGAAPSTELVCDGKTDDTAALTWRLARGAPIKLPSGTCMVSGATAANVTVDLTADQPGLTVLKALPGSEKDILRLHDVMGRIEGVVFDQVGAKGDAAGLRIIRGSGFAVRQIQVRNPNNFGVLLDGCIGCSLDGLTSPGGGTHGAWIVAFENGRNNRIMNVSSRNAVNRTLVVEFESGDEIVGVEAVDGLAEAVLLEGVSRSTGRHWRYSNHGGLGKDDAFAMLGDSQDNRIADIVALKPAGFGFTFASTKSGQPRYNIVSDLIVVSPGQQIMSFTDDGQQIGPYCNVVTGLDGRDANQQKAKFPGLDFFGAKENRVYGSIRSSDRLQRYAVVETDSTAPAGGNSFLGVLEPGYDGLTLTRNATGSPLAVGRNPHPPADPTAGMTCFASRR